MIFKNKRAQGIPMETVIIAIIVLVVLVVIIAFFVGGTSSITDKIRNAFKGSQGDDLAIIKPGCQSLCQAAIDSNLGENSKYCTQKYKLDTQGKGTSDTTTDNNGKQVPKAYYCDSAQIGAGCSITCPSGRSDIY